MLSKQRQASDGKEDATGVATGDGAPPSPAVSAPKGGGAIRGIGEKFSVNPATGTAALDVPILTSPCRHDFYPRLSLSYDSGAGNGPFGLGWTLSVPAVSRKTAKGLPRYQDGEYSDTFVLSGAEDLVPSLIRSDGDWTEDILDREDAGEAFEVRRYRPRIEGLFARIEKWEARNGGEVHWRSISKNNVTSVYGRSPSAKLADTDDGSRAFSWLLEESYDDKGDVVRYEYKSENADNVDRSLPYEGNRHLAQGYAGRYLKRIKYGNKKPHERGGWLFEVVFDYGEHDAANPTPDEVLTWPVRPDAFSSCRAGFEIRTYRLCRRVLMFHRFEELGSSPYLVRSTDFHYDESPIAAYLAAVTQRGYIQEEGGEGYEAKPIPPLEFSYTRAGVDETIRFIDAESLENLPAGLGTGRYRWVDLDGEGIPGVLTEQGGGWFYKSNLGGVHFDPARLSNERPAPPPTARATGPPRFARTRLVAPEPSLANLGAGHQQIMDLAGDGRQDLVLLGGSMPGYYERENGRWESFTPFRSSPNVDWGNRNLRLVELGGDGHADVLVTEDEVFTWYPSLAEDGFGAPQSVRLPGDEERGPALVFADATESIHLADMSGDGLTDIVRIRGGEICYWPSLGYGRFGAKVTMGAAPRFDHPDRFEHSRFRLADIDGSGTTDIIYLGPDGASFWFNQSGNGWSDAHRLASFPVVDDLSAVTVVDLLGNGTACLVWSSPLPGDARRPVRYVDLMGGQKPHLLSSVRNNMGAETRIRYAPSTRFYLADRVAGRPWVTRLPFPVHVVERVEARDEVGRTKLVTLYRYHHGHFDGVEREFRGFGLVEQWDTEFFAQFGSSGLFPTVPSEMEEERRLPPVYTKSWFHTGAYLGREKISRHFAGEYYAGDPQAALLPDAILPSGLSADEEREACRSLTGMPLRREIYAADDSPESVHPYVVSEHNYELRRIQPIKDVPHAVFHAHARETLTYHYERNPVDPRAVHEMTLEVDDFGNVTKSAAIGYPRRARLDGHPPEQDKTAITYTETDHTEAVDTADAYRTPLPAETRIDELTGVPRTGGEPFALSDIRAAARDAADIAYEAQPAPGATERRLIERTRTRYYTDDLSGPLPLGEAGSPALPFESYRMVFTPGLLEGVYGDRLTDRLLADEGRYVFREGVWWAPSGRQIFDPDRFYLPVEFVDPFGQRVTTTYDEYALLVTRTRDPLGSEVSARNDYRTMRPAEVTDPNGNRTAVRFDTLGMVVATAVMGKVGETDPAKMGDTLDDPTTRLEYELFNWTDHGRPNVVHTLARERHGVANPRWQESYTYSDGFGREVSTKVQAEPGPAPARGEDGELVHDEDGELVWVDDSPELRWVGTGRTVFDNKGNPIKQYEPFFSSTPAYEDEEELVEWGVTPVLRYDPLGRLVRTDHPSGTFSRVEFDPWRQATWDENDTVLESGWYAERGSPDPSGGEPADPESRAAWLAGQHAGTPTVAHLDALGRTFLTVADNGPRGTFETGVQLDIEGNPLAITDARGNEAEANAFDLLGQRLYRNSMDAGERWALNNAAGNPLRLWDGRGHRFRTSYDELQRPTHLFVRSGDGAEVLVERTVYGEALGSGAAALNQRGQVYRTYDGAGVATNEEFDFKGNLLRGSRRLAGDYKETVNWSALAELTDPSGIEAAAAPSLEAEVFTTSTRYDALDRPVSGTTPDGSETLQTYNEANLLERVDVRLRGAEEATSFVADVGYNARGQRERISYGNGVTTAYGYDRATFRLANLKSTRGSDGTVLQDLSYTYDPVGNIAEIRDDAQQTVFFDNTVVSPGTRYEYDALFWLIRAEGREHAGQNAGTPRDHAGPPRTPLPHPNDAQAMRRYTERYEYDEAGNIQRVSHQAGSSGSWTLPYDYAPDSNRLLATGLPGDDPDGRLSGRYAYDAHGNMTSMPHLARIDWDFEDQMHRVDLGGGGSAYYVYDAAGQRVRKVHEHNGATAEERIYLGGYEIYRERVGDNLRLERESLHVMDDQSRIALVETRTLDAEAPILTPAPVIRYQLDNHLGSACLETDEAGSVISYEEYHPYGTTSYHSARGQAEVSLKRYRFTGKERDDESGLYYHGARYYAPWLGRWTSCDPAGMVDGPNLYMYAKGKPSTLADPSGRQACRPPHHRNEQPRPPSDSYSPKQLETNVRQWITWQASSDRENASTASQLNELSRKQKIYDEHRVTLAAIRRDPEFSTYSINNERVQIKRHRYSRPIPFSNIADKYGKDSKQYRQAMSSQHAYFGDLREEFEPLYWIIKWLETQFEPDLTGGKWALNPHHFSPFSSPLGEGPSVSRIDSMVLGQVQGELPVTGMKGMPAPMANAIGILTMAAEVGHLERQSDVAGATGMAANLERAGKEMNLIFELVALKYQSQLGYEGYFDQSGAEGVVRNRYEEFGRVLSAYKKSRDLEADILKENLGIANLAVHKSMQAPR